MTRQRNSLLETYLRGAEPKDPESPSMKSMRNWISAFKGMRKHLESIAKKGAATDIRKHALEKATNDLLKFTLVTIPSEEAALATAIDLLEKKLNEMISVLRGQKHSLIDRDCLPAHLIDVEGVELLRQEYLIKERAFLFKGLIREVVHEYRDEGKALIAAERNKLVENLEQGLDATEKAVRDFNSYLLIRQELADESTECISAMYEAMEKLESLYRFMAFDDSFEPLLQANRFQIRTQYVVACAKICLQLYGNVSPEILKLLLSLKSMDYMNRWDIGQIDDGTREAERKRLDREIDHALPRMRERAKRGNWPTLPLLELFLLNPKYGCKPVKVRRGRAEQGLASGVLHE